MSAIEKLEALLSRVQTRRAMPRQASDSSTAFSSSAPGTGRVSKVPAPTPLEEALDLVVPVDRQRESLPSAFEVRAPAPAPESEELFLDDFEPSTPTLQPSPMPTGRPSVAQPAPAPLAVAQPAPAPLAVAQPAAAPAPMVAKPAPITAATARIEPAAPMSTSPLSVVSAAPRFEPKNFGDLLELSLALRPLK